MIIKVANLTLRFYVDDGWTEKELRKYIHDDSLKIIYREKLKYFAVYASCGHKVFTKNLLNHEFDNPFNNDINWYIGE